MDLTPDEVYAWIIELQDCGSDDCVESLGWMFTDDELAMADVARAIALLV